MSLQSAASLAVFLVAVFVTAATGATFSPGQWYADLTKPSWTPPSWLFPPVWTTLYVMIAVAGWLVWERRTQLPGAPGIAALMALFAAQLVLNAAWSWLFFGLHRPLWALVDIVLLWASIAALIALFWRVRPLAGGLLIPYLLWVSYATALNAALWQLNPAP